MKHLKFLLLASLVAFAACDEDDQAPEQFGSVNVTVTSGGAPLQGVTVSLGAAGTTPQTTSAAGTASFTNVPVGTYTVTLTGVPADVVCSSTTQPVTVAAQQTTAVTFACNVVRTSSISGTVAFSNGDPRPNAAITITRTLPAPADPAVNLTTNAQGQYSLTGLRSGTYTVSLAVTTGCTTAANTQTVTVAAGEARVVNFTCTVAPQTEPATVAIQSITAAPTLPTDHPTLQDECPNAGTSLEPSQLSCRVNVTVGIEEGQQTVTRLELVLGTTVVYTQNFGAAPVPEEMQLATFNVVATINTAAFNATTGVPAFLNGNINLVARIFTPQSATTPVHTASLAATLANPDLVVVNVTLPRTALGTQAPTIGLRWEGGSLTATGLPVMYSGKTVTRMVFTVHCPDLGDTGTITDTASPFSALFPDDEDCDDAGVDDVEDPEVTVSVTTVLSDNQPGPDFETAEIRVDNVGPTLSDLDNAIRTSRWINAPWNFGADENQAIPTGEIDPITREDEGVAGITLAFAAGTSTANVAAVTTGNDLAESADDMGYVLRITARDALQNATVRWFNYTSAGLSDTSGNRATVDANHRFGVDKTNPTLTFSNSSTADSASSTGANLTYDASFFDPVSAAGGSSGFEATPVATTVRRDNAQQTNQCFVGSGSSCSFTNQALPWVFSSQGYVRVTFRVFDRAGNMTTSPTRIGLRDTNDPLVGNVSVPPSLTGGQAANFQVNMADSVDLGTARLFQGFGGTDFGFAAPQTLGTYGLPLAISTLVSTNATFVRGIETAGGGTPDGSFINADEATVVGSDVAGNEAESSSTFTFNRPAGSKTTFGTAITNWAVASSQASVCSSVDPDDCGTGDDPTSTTLTPTLVGTTAGLANNPFPAAVRVMWRLSTETRWRIAGTSTATGANDVGGVRTWSFTGVSFSVPAEIVGASLEFLVVGIDNQGDALVSSLITVTVTNP
jgi:hypothetical protein